MIWANSITRANTITVLLTQANTTTRANIMGSFGDGHTHTRTEIAGQQCVWMRAVSIRSEHAGRRPFLQIESDIFEHFKHLSLIGTNKRGNLGWHKKNGIFVWKFSQIADQK